MKRGTPTTRLLFTTLFPCLVIASLPAQDSTRRLVELGGSWTDNTYRSDSNGQFQYGTPILQFTGDGYVGFMVKATPYFGLALGATHETIDTSNLPSSVLNAAAAFSNPPLRLDRTSLRLQNAFGFRIGMYVLRDLQLGARYNQDSWRYDWLGFPAHTTIPYLKGIQWNTTAFLRYTKDLWRFRAMLDGGIGYTRVDFHQGEEAYLADHDSSLLARESGKTFPVSVEVGYNIMKSGSTIYELGLLAPFVRYDYSWTSLTGDTKIRKRQLVFGITIGTR